MVYKSRLESAVPEKKAFGRTTDCKAHGCPFPGGIRLTNYTSICRVHEDLEPHFWPIATERICRRVDELDRAIAALNGGPSANPSYEQLIVELRKGLQ